MSVIVPARNEEASLGACLKSLTNQTGVSAEIILVDDASTDRTREIAQSFPPVRVVDAGPPPARWTGKNNALVAGAAVAGGEWLLFTDADTVHLPGSLARAVAEASRRGASLLSYSPEQEVHGFWEKAVMPVIFAELAATYRPALVSDPGSPAAAANGQYILIARAAYDAIGGHAAVSASLLEDVALARAVKASGRRIFFRFGGDAVRTRMYRSFSQLREGWTKNLALLFASPARLALLRLTGVCADCRRRGRGRRGPAARPHQAGRNGSAFGRHDVRFSAESNSPGTFFLAAQPRCLSPAFRSLRIFCCAPNSVMKREVYGGREGPTEAAQTTRERMPPS